MLVVGAGPVGLLTAYRLRSLGLSCLVLEKRLELSRASKASTFQPGCLDRLASLGLLADLLQHGHRVEMLRHLELPSGRRRDHAFASLKGYTRHAFRLHLEQHWLCELLLERLHQLQPAGQPAVLWGQPLVALDCNPAPNQRQPITVWVGGNAPQQQKLSARWLVAADGARSTVRQLLRLPFDGHDLPAPVLRLMLDRLPEAVEEQLAGLTYIRHPLGALSALRMRGHWRLILRPTALEIEPALADEQWARQRLAQVFSSVSDSGAWERLPMVRDHYQVSQRCVSVRQRGRCLLIGDAAHITNTRGGLNMNFGLLEGLELAETLASSSHQDGSDQRLAVRAWAHLWQQRTHSVLMARTARLLDGRSPWEPDHGDLLADNATKMLHQASLLDLKADKEDGDT